MLRALTLLALALAGCTENAAFELSLDLPQSRSEMVIDEMGNPVMVRREWAFVQVRTGADNPFEVDWDGRDLDAIQLDPMMRTADHISILSQDESVNLNVKIRFCVDVGCNGFEDTPAPAHWIAIEHPFYIGERTEFAPAAPIDMPPMAPEMAVCSSDCDDFACTPATSGCDVNFVDKCSVRGCVTGDPSASYCRGGGSDDATHFCEGD